jgi:hypothetical protein
MTNRRDIAPRRAGDAIGSASRAVYDAEIGKQLDHERRRSRVRVNVTYMATVSFLATAVGIIFYLISCQKMDQALGVFASLASISAAILGFWFGSRGYGSTGTAQRLTGATGAVEEGAQEASDARGDEIRQLQSALVAHAESLPDGRLKDSMNPGPIDGVLNSRTRTAIDNFLSTMDPPLGFAELAEPRIENVLSYLAAT